MIFCTFDATMTLFVAGYIARSICRRRKCLTCKDLFIKNMETLDIENYNSSDQLHLLKMFDRGDLSHPSDFCSAVYAIAVHFYTHIQ